MKTATPATITSTTSPTAATPDVWLSSRELRTLRVSISDQTLQDLFDYQQEMWHVLYSAHGLEFFGYPEAQEMAPLDDFVRMLIADSKGVRDAALKAAFDAQAAAWRANLDLTSNPLWKLKHEGFLVLKP